MGKIFEALKKTEGDLADLALPMVTAENSGTGQAAATAREAIEETEPFDSGMDDSAAAEESFESSPAPAHSHFQAQPETGRTLPVRIRADAPILPFHGGNSRVGEQYRIARTRIIQHPNQPQLIVVSSSGSGDGKTVSATNLAGALALKSDAQVMLVEADMRRPSMSALLGLPSHPGLAEYLSGKCEFEDIVIHVEQFPNLSFVPAGRSESNPSELLDSARWGTACEEFRRRSRFVIIDAPPMKTVADYDLIEANCDGVVFVVRPDLSNRKLCLERLASVPSDKLIGVLLNCVQDWLLWKTKDQYYYTAN